ncbi:MAG: hypothetical protein HPY44_19490 [Armatimonadetes bacterium]|nr:hypothetical protein [Armatimonadota bacterium]
MANRAAMPLAALFVLAFLATGSELLAAPQVVNGSFEADAYTKSPGLCAQHRNRITGWEASGNVGINPIWKDAEKRSGPASPFFDNGAIPHGRQIALIQGPGSITQRIAGFEKGHRYVVTFRENGRVQRQGDGWPVVRVRLGDRIIVSPHEVPPVARKDEYHVPFARVVSAVFTAPEDGELDLVIETIQELRTTTVFLDDVKIQELREGPGAP